MKVYLTPKAQKGLKTIPQKDKEKIIKKLLLLEQNPTSGKYLTGKLRGFSSLRAWPYRIIYQIISHQVWIVHIMHRKDVYKH